MVDQYVIFSSFMLLAGVVAAVVGVLAWNHRDSPGGTPLVVMSGATALWSVGYGVPIFVPDATLSYWIGHSRHFFAALTALSWIFVAVEYLEIEKLQRRPVVATLVGILLLEGLILLTDPFHNLFMAERGVTADGRFVDSPGPLFWVHSIFWLGLVLGTFMLFVREFLDARGVYRKQTGAICLGGGVALLLIVIQQATDPVDGLSINIVGMTIMCFTLLWAMFQADFLETAPVARKTLVESMDDAVIALDDNDTVVDLNPEAMALLGVDSHIIGSHGAAVFAAYPTMVERFSTTYDIETEVELDRDGNTRHYSVNISPVTATGEKEPNANRILGRIIVVRDITEQVAREKQLAAQKAALERQNERLDQFAAVISHDLRNPLNSATGFLDIARETGEDEHFQKVSTAHDRMETMIDELLTLARTETDLDATDVESIRLTPLVDAAWETAETDGASLERALPDEWTVAGDRALLGNVLENLFRNAADHNDRSVTVRVGCLTGSGDEPVGFFVEDDGDGIPDDERDAVFTHGYTTSRTGTGFGLSIVKELVETHGWEITVGESSDGGARFDVRFRDG